MTCLITGATGDVGSKVVEFLLRRNERPRILVRDANKARARFGDQVDVFVGDLADATSLRSALNGIEGFFLVNSGPQIPARDELAAKVAHAAGVRRLVKLSSMDVEQGLAIGAWHEKGEAAVRASGITYTLVRPSGFMTNLLAWAPAIRTEGIVRSSTGDGRRAFIHSHDIAAVVTEVLLSRKYDGQTLTITGPEALTFAEIAVRIAAAIGKPMRYECISDDEARHRYAATGAPAEETEAHVSLWRAIREGRLATVTHQVEYVLGRKPTMLAQWILENADQFRPQQR